MDAPAFDTKRLVRPALRIIALYLSIIVIASMTTVKPAYASGTVSTLNTYFAAGSGFGNYINAATPAEACDRFAKSPQVTGPVVTQISSSQWQCTYTYVDNGTNFLMWVFYVSPACPANSSGTVTCTCTDPYVPDSTRTSCVVPPACPAHASGTPCACEAGYQLDAAGTSCIDACPGVPALTPLPKDDACANVLENINSTQAQKDAACGALTDNLKAGMACFSDKLSRTNDIVSGNPIPLKITSDIRDIAYQAHFREIWDKMEKLVPLMKNDPAMQTACAVRRAEIAAEKGCDNAGPCVGVCNQAGRNHCIRGKPAKPSPNDAQHTQGNAFDVSYYYTIEPLQAALGGLRPPQTIPQFLDDPTNCNLKWGGTIKTNIDLVHFYAP